MVTDNASSATASPGCEATCNDSTSYGNAATAARRSHAIHMGTNAAYTRATAATAPQATYCSSDP